MTSVTVDNLDALWKELTYEDPRNHPDVIMVHKGWGIERIRQVVKSGATLMMNRETYDWIKENL
jgi:hypothetical protein